MAVPGFVDWRYQTSLLANEHGEPDWDEPLPIDCPDDVLFEIIHDAIEVWAEMEGVSEETFYEASSCFVLLSTWDGIALDRVEVASFGIVDKPLIMNDRQKMECKHANSRAWRQFAIGICKSDCMKELLQRR